MKSLSGEPVPAPRLSSSAGDNDLALSAAGPDLLQPGMLARVLDEIDYGLLLLDLGGRILHANHPARQALSAELALRDVDGVLSCGDVVGQRSLRQALQDAGRGCRSIVELAHDSDPLSLAFVPLDGGAANTVLVMCSRRHGCESLTMQMFARAKGLTRSEQGVLSQLCAGHRADEIASRQGVRLSTVRTHIKNVRQKTGSNSIGEVVYRVSRMPQVTSALRLAARG